MGLFDRQENLRPNHYPWTQDFIDAMWHGFWTPTEFDFKSDYADFKSNMTEEEKGVTLRSLAAIGHVERQIKTKWARLGDNFPHPAIYDLGYVMANTEVIHSQAYTRLFDILGLTDELESLAKEPVFERRVTYLKKHLRNAYESDKKQYVYSLILFTLFVENVSLFSQFYAVLWFARKKSLLTDTAQQIEYTRLEEQIHSKVGIKLINTLREEYPELFDEELERKVIEEAHEAFEAESKIVDWIMGEFADEDISAPILKSYICQRMNESLEEIGYDKLFEIDQDHYNSFMWMDEELYGNSKTDFFPKKPKAYTKNDKTYNEEDIF